MNADGSKQTRIPVGKRQPDNTERANGKRENCASNI
jgi:hypothetical protein